MQLIAILIWFCVVCVITGFQVLWAAIAFLWRVITSGPMITIRAGPDRQAVIADLDAQGWNASDAMVTADRKRRAIETLIAGGYSKVEANAIIRTMLKVKK